MMVHVIHWEYNDKSASGIIGVFDDSDMANAVYDALEITGDTGKRYFLDNYKLNEVKK
jgi:hypothetical protein